MIALENVLRKPPACGLGQSHAVQCGQSSNYDFFGLGPDDVTIHTEDVSLLSLQITKLFVVMQCASAADLASFPSPDESDRSRP